MGAATHLAFSVQPAGFTSEGVLTTQPVVQALDAGGAVDTTFTGIVTLTPSVPSTQFYVVPEPIAKVSHTVQAGSTSTAYILSPALSFPTSLPANYSGMRASLHYTWVDTTVTPHVTHYDSAYIASNTGTTQANLETPINPYLGAGPQTGDTVYVRSGCMFDSQAAQCVAGVATFSGLSLSGHEATALVASATGLTSATSNTLTPTGTFDGAAELPRVTVDTTSPTYDATVYTINPANPTDASPNWKTFSQCIADLTASDTGNHRLVLVQGGDYTGFVTLKNRAAGMGWITFRWNANPLSAGQRATPSNMVGCPRITTKDNNAGVMGPQTYAGGNVVHHYRFEGIDFQVQTPTNPTTFLIGQVVAIWDGVGSTAAGLPHHIGFDQCMVRGTSATELQRGIYLGAKEFFFTNGYICNVHQVGNGDTQTITGAGTSQGPHLIQNNYLEAAGEVTMFGGGDTAEVGLVCSDIQIIGNHYRVPVSWKPNPIFTYVSGSTWNTKNLFELKSGRRIQVEGNVFENRWYGAQDVAFVIGSASQSATSPWQGTRDVVVRKNVFRNINQWATFSGENPGAANGLGAQVLIRRFRMHDNLVIQNNALGTPYSEEPSSNPKILQLANGIRHLEIVHNTILANPTSGTSSLYGITASGIGGRFDYNILANPYYGAQSVANGGQYYKNAFIAHFPVSQAKNVLLDTDSGHGGATSQYDNTWGFSTTATVGFADASPLYANVRPLTFAQLVTKCTLASGTYANTTWTGDSKMVGADMTALSTAIANSWVPGEGTALDGVEPGATTADHLALTTQPSASTVSGVAHATQPAGVVQDASNATVTSDASTVTASWVNATGTGTAGGTLTATVSSGAWAFTNLKVTSAAGCTGHWHFTDGSLTGVDSNTITITATASTADHLALSVQPTGAVSGVALTTQPVVLVEDSSNATVTTDTSTVTAAWTTLTGDASLSGTTTAVAVAGIATFATLALTWSVDSTGYFTFTDGSLASTTSSTLTLDVIEPVPPSRTYPTLTVSDPQSTVRQQWRRKLSQWRQLAGMILL